MVRDCIAVEVREYTKSYYIFTFAHPSPEVMHICTVKLIDQLSKTMKMAE